MAANVGGIDRTLRIVVGIVLIALFFVLEGTARYVGLLGLVALVHGAVQLLPALHAARHQHLPDEERLSRTVDARRRGRRRPARRVWHGPPRVHAIADVTQRLNCSAPIAPGLPRHLAAAPEHDQRRDAADPESRGDVLRLLGVQLREPDVRLHALRRLLERRAPSSGTARTTAPRNPRPRAGRSSPTCWSKLPLVSSTG